MKSAQHFTVRLFFGAVRLFLYSKLRPAPQRDGPKPLKVGSYVSLRDPFSPLQSFLLITFGLCLARERTTKAAETVFPTSQGQIVVPNVDATTPGSINTDTPFIGLNTYRLQVYDASQFTPLKDGAYITGVSFRMQEGQAAPFDVTYSHFEVQLATFPRPINTLESIYHPQNYSDATLVFSHDNAHFSGTSSTSTQIPSPFDFQISFDKPFFYDPNTGNLLMYLQSGRIVGGNPLQIDLEDRLTPVVGYSAAGVLGGSVFGANSATLVAQFDYITVPEPPPGGIMLLGVVTLLLRSRYASRRCTS